MEIERAATRVCQQQIATDTVTATEEVVVVGVRRETGVGGVTVGGVSELSTQKLETIKRQRRRIQIFASCVKS